MSAIYNPPAFPVADVMTHDGFGLREGSPGMTLRDWFAGQALSFAAFYATDSENHPMRQDFLPEEWAAKMAYAFADAMLVARSTFNDADNQREEG